MTRNNSSTGSGGEGSGAAGFTLVEVLVALAVTGLLLGALLQAYSSGLRTLRVADGQQTAALLASSLLAETAAMEMKSGRSSGTLQGFDWRRDIEDVSLTDLPASLSDSGWQAFQVTVTVSWDETRSFSLTSLRLGEAR